MKEYSNGEITIVWKPELCIHAKNCWHGLIEVFNPEKDPWINAKGASKERIIKQINECPSEALSYYHNGKKEEVLKQENNKKEEKESTTVEIDMIENGPFIIRGNVYIKDKDGNKNSQKNPVVLCRCGKSKNKPYCDGSHSRQMFK